MKRIPGCFAGSGELVGLDGREQGQQVSPRFEDKAVYFGSLDGNLHFYDPTTGGQGKLLELGDGITYMDEIDGLLYLCCESGKIWSYDIVTKEHEQIAKADAPISCVKKLDKILYFGDSAGGLYFNNLIEKKQEKIAKADDSISCIEKIDGVLYFGDVGGNLYSYIPSKKKRRQGVQKKLAEVRNKIIALEGHGTYYWNKRKKGNGYVIERILLGCSDGRLYGYRLATGERYPIPFNCYYGIVVADVNYSISGSCIRSCDLDTSKERRLVEFDNKIDGLSELDGILYFGIGNALHSYNLNNRTHQRVAEADGPVKCIVS